MGFVDRLVGRSKGSLPTVRPRLDAFHVLAAESLASAPAPTATTERDATRRLPPTTSRAGGQVDSSGTIRTAAKSQMVDLELTDLGTAGQLSADAGNRSPDRIQPSPRSDPTVPPLPAGTPVDMVDTRSPDATDPPSPSIVEEPPSRPSSPVEPTHPGRLPTLLPESESPARPQLLLPGAIKSVMERQVEVTEASPEASPDVHVTIGRVEVVAPGPGEAPPRPIGPALSLSEYLERRESS